MTDYDHLEVTTADHVTTVCLNRPDQLNALNERLTTELLDVLLGADADEATRVLVLTGAGRGFCSGFDVADLARMATAQGDPVTPPRMRDVMRGTSTHLARALLDVETPMVAAVNGPCAGAGIALALACDVVLASDAASFSVTFTRRGLVPDYGVSWLLPRLVGLRRARELCLLADTLPAAEAAELGLVTRVVAADDLAGDAAAVAGRLAEGAGVALKLTKRLLTESFDVDRQTAIDREFTAQALCFASDDATEGAAAFFEKREPRFAWR